MMWHFFSPKIFYGEGALAALENINGKKCFIVTDNVMEELGYVNILTDTLKKYGKEFMIFKMDFFLFYDQNSIIPSFHYSMCFA